MGWIIHLQLQSIWCSKHIFDICPLNKSDPIRTNEAENLISPASTGDLHLRSSDFVKTHLDDTAESLKTNQLMKINPSENNWLNSESH